MISFFLWNSSVRKHTEATAFCSKLTWIAGNRPRPQQCYACRPHGTSVKSMEPTRATWRLRRRGVPIAMNSAPQFDPDVVFSWLCLAPSSGWIWMKWWNMKKCCFGFNGNSYCCPRRAVFIELQPEDGCNNPPLCAWVPVRTCLAPLVSWLPVWVCQSFVNVLHWHFESCFLFELKTSSVLKALHPTLLALEFAETPARAAAGGKTCCSKCARRAEGWISDQLKEMDYFQNWPQMTQMYENSMKFISCF